jgi:dihydrodipicolinate synthase/N-acetylneuraminate lyase
MNAEHGIYPILYAFYGPDGQLNRSAMQRQVACCLEAGAHGIAVLGLITEVGQLSDAERRKVVEWAAEDINGQVPLAVTVAGETAEQQMEFAKGSVSAGADWLILQPPRKSAPPERELMTFFGRTMEAVEVPVGIQNFPEVLGVGLSPVAVGELHRQQPNFTVMKGEGPVYQIRRYLDETDGQLGIFNGRGGLELPDNLRAGCAGIIPAPDCADVQIAMYEAFARGDLARADALYTATLAYVTFVMQSIDFALQYGKRLTARRMGIEGDPGPRGSAIASDAFGLERLAAHADILGDFGHWRGVADDAG